MRLPPAQAAAAFAGASFLPVPLLLAAALWGGVWAWAALAYVTLFAFAMDSLIDAFATPLGREGSEFPAADHLAAALGVAHFAVLAAVVWRLGQGLGTPQAVPLYVAAGLFMGQISNANAHELIHRPARGLRWLGVAVFSSVLFGHHASAHPLVHHVHVATRRDPNTPRRGEGYYRFLLRAWIGSMRAGFLAEQQRRARAKTRRMHPFATYALLSGLTLIAAWALGGALGLAAFVGLCLFTPAQLLLSDYVQHYGLERREADGRVEPVGPQHSWNAPQLFTSHMMLNAPRHSAHHTRPDLRYDALWVPAGDAAPTLPASLPAMSCLALVPPLWRKLMDPRAARWRRIPP